MNYAEYLEINQPIPYKIFKTALEEKTLFHAYLLVGEIGTPLGDISKFLAASIIDPEADPFTNTYSVIYKRILDDNYADLIFLDCEKNSVKIDQIREIQDRFSKTASERAGIKVYIINQVENLGVDSCNALLKFLEEAPENTYAFLLTNSEFRLLPTIRSRVQAIRFSLINQENLIKDAISLGANEADAELLSFFYNDPHVIFEKTEDKDYLTIKNIVIKTLENADNYEELLTFTLNTTVKTIKDKVAARLFFDYLIVLFKEILKYKLNNETILDKYVNIFIGLKNLTNIEDDILKLMDSRNEIGYNVNLSLILVHTITTIFGK